ncbi:MAG: hypothetical protein VYD19_10570 [Myxococcota bacterium]|nr:hypothetical protein [Myxococcota bacterium]
MFDGKGLLLFAYILLCLCATREALAHGGSPRPIAILFPDGPTRPLLVDNLGLFQRRGEAAGGDWRWLCDDAIDFETAVEGALYLAEGELLALSRRGLHKGGAGGCRWQFIEGESLDQHAFEAKTLHQSSTGYLIGTSTLGRGNTLLYSEDGARWQPVIEGIEGPIYRVISAPNHPGQVYANNAEGAALSEDGGRSWRPMEIQLSDEALSPREIRLLAVSPLDPAHLFATQVAFPRSQLLESRDRGASWSSRWSVEDNIEELVISPEGELRMATSFSGLWGFSLTEEGNPSLISPDAVGCLRFGPAGALWSCGRSDPPRWLIARSDDLGAAWTVELEAYPLTPAPWCSLSEPSTISCVGQCTPDAPPEACGVPDQGPPPNAGHGHPDFGLEISIPQDEGCMSVSTGRPTLDLLLLISFLLLCPRRRFAHAQLLRKLSA